MEEFVGKNSGTMGHQGCEATIRYRKPVTLPEVEKTGGHPLPRLWGDPGLKVAMATAEQHGAPAIDATHRRQRRKVELAGTRFRNLAPAARNLDRLPGKIPEPGSLPMAGRPRRYRGRNPTTAGSPAQPAGRPGGIGFPGLQPRYDRLVDAHRRGFRRPRCCPTKPQEPCARPCACRAALTACRLAQFEKIPTTPALAAPRKPDRRRESAPARLADPTTLPPEGRRHRRPQRKRPRPSRSNAEKKESDAPPCSAEPADLGRIRARQPGHDEDEDPNAEGCRQDLDKLSLTRDSQTAKSRVSSTSTRPSAAEGRHADRPRHRCCRNGTTARQRAGKPHCLIS